MRIIKEGRKPIVEIEKECPVCGCVFAYERKDVRHYTQYNETSYYVNCPHCNKSLMVDGFPQY